MSAIEGIIDFITSGNISDLSNLTDDNDSIECKTSLANIPSDDPNGSELSDEDDQPLSNYAKTASKQTNYELKAA